MSEIFEIAYAAASNRLCLFTGTGFSKAITGNLAPGWQPLLEYLCDLTANSANLKTALFPVDGQYPLSLEETAQIISIELVKKDKEIHEEIANKIRNIKLVGDNSHISSFLSKRTLSVITTNYDKLLEELAGSQDCHSLTPGLPIPRSQSRVKVYHVHGSIDSPENMVVTADDYFQFINTQSYFARKLSTILHENTVVILGYSLSDNNLKAILSDYKWFSRNHVIGSNLILVSRNKVDQHIKDYYGHCYGIRVLDEMEIHTFFKELNLALPGAEKIVNSSMNVIKDVIMKGYVFKDEYLKVENSFFEIIASLAAIGLGIKNQRVVTVLGDIITTKTRLTKEYNAWEQYEHLAKWLIYLASIFELKGVIIEEVFLEAVLRSMNTMSRRLITGYSWHSFAYWEQSWSNILPSNRALIRKFIATNTSHPDALSIVNRE